MSAKELGIPAATYRLQFNAGFRFSDARRIIQYLHTLGISRHLRFTLLHRPAGVFTAMTYWTRTA